MPTPPSIEAALQRWVAAGLIQPAQADAIRAAEAAEPAAAPRSSLLAEALGYVGGVLVLVAAVTLTGRFWDELGTGGRLAVAAVAALVLFVAGAAAPAPHTGASGRLRAVVWLLSVAALAGTIGLLGDEVLGLANDVLVLLAAACATVYAGLLWQRHHAVPQHVAFIAALVVTAGSAAALLPGPAGEPPWLAVWGVGVAWLLLGWGGVVAPRPAAYACGGVAVVVGSLVVADSAWGAILAVGSAIVLVVGGVLDRDLVLLGVGAVAMLVTVPRVVADRFPDTVVVAFVLLVLGIALVGAGLFVARRRSAAGPAKERGAPAPAIAAAAVVAVGTAVAVVALGL